MAVFYDQFYRRYGVRTPMILMSPPTPMLEKFQFPQNSIYHFYTYEGTAPGPAGNEYLFRDIEKPIAVEHILDATSMEGDPRVVPVQARTIINKFHATNRRYRWMRQGILSLRDVRSLAVMNYALLTNRYRYKRTILSNYSKWFNITKTVWDTMGKLAVESPRHQFYFVDTPSILSSIQTYQRVAERGVIPPLLKYVNTPEKAFFQQLWNWIDPATRSDTIFTAIPVEELKKINLIFRESGRFVMINMGRLYDWIDHGTTADVLDLKKKGIAPIRMQKILLRMMLSLSALRADSSDIVPDDTGEDDTVASIQATALSSTSPSEQDMDEVDNNKEKTKADELTEMMENLDKDLAELDNLQKKREESGFEDTPITELETQEDSVFDETSPPEHTQAAITERVQQPESKAIVTPADFRYDPTAEQAVSAVADALAEEGLISASEYKRVIKTAANYKNLKAPDGQGTLEEYAKIDPEILVVPDQVPLKVDSQFVTDPSMLRSSLKDMTQTYAKKVLHKDVANMVIDIQRAGNSITEYEKEKVEDALGAYEIHTVRLKPVVGQASTLRFKLPVIDDDGNYTSNGVKYKARLQRVDLPIRKIGPETVALSSYYGKTFVKRSSKKVDDWGDWLRNKILADGLGENKVIRNIVPRIVFDPEFECPYLFSQLAMGFESFSAKGFDFALSKETRVAMFTPEEFKQYEVDGSRLIAKNIEGGVIFVNKNDNLCIVPVPGSEIVVARADDFFEFYGGPVLQVDVKIFGKEIPIGIVLGYKYGLERLIKKLNISYRRVMAGERAKATTDEWVMKFSDETLIFKRSDRLATLILSGFNSFEKVIKNYSVFTFDKPGVYLNLLDNMGLSARYLREIDLMDQLFVDSITKGILADMGEPQDFRGLLIRSCQMLLNDNHKNQQDMSEMRLRGYERMAGAVYNEMVQSIRAHNGRPGKAMQKIEMHPFAVWKRIAQDPSVMVVGDINPIENLKDEEGVTYTGEGGRSKRAMVKRNRIYHESDMGVISEATKDSSDVAINIYTSANPRFKNLRGQTRDFDLKRDGVASLVSTSALLAPCSDKDDPKRVGFVSIQNAHAIACASYKQSRIRTGYEYVMAKRVGSMFAQTAKQDGKVIKVTANGIQVQYQDGTVQGYEIGRTYGAYSGLTLPHYLKAHVTVGQDVKAGDVLYYNEGFFEPDHLDPKQVIWKKALLCKVVLLESTQTLEDASSISKRLAEELTTEITKTKEVTLSFDQVVRSMKTPGEALEPDSILCIIEDAVTAGANLFDEESLDTLRLLSNQSPRAKVKGKLERVEVYYHGDKEDMSESIRNLAEASDAQMAKRKREAGKKPVSGSVNDDMRVGGEPLQMGQVVIRFYITSQVPAVIGDKAVFANQMKTVISEVMENDYITESGTRIDAIFGSKSIDDRIVESPYIIGTSNTLLGVGSRRAVDIYRGKIK